VPDATSMESIIETFLATLKSQQERIEALDATVQELIEAHKVHAEALVTIVSALPPGVSLNLAGEADRAQTPSAEKLRSMLRIVRDDDK
jgi:hypothetical protein